MRMSRHFGHTLREAPGEAETTNHSLLLRAGFIDQLMSGVYSFMPLGNRTRLRIERIVREEMDRAGAQEVHLPAIQPVELWEQSGRKEVMGSVLFQLVDRRERGLALGPTHEEVVTRLFGDHSSSYRDLPVTLYQIQTKFRDEARPRGGLIRVREFTMKDAYSFDLDDAGLDASYEAMFKAYERICARVGVPVTVVEADSGAIGGKGSQEFAFLTAIGEDSFVLCENGDYAANTEKAEFLRSPADPEGEEALEEIATPETSTIEDLARLLEIPTARTAKAVFYMAATPGDHDWQPIFVVIRGDLEVNELKLSNVLGGLELRAMRDDEVAEYGLIAGYASPRGISAQVRVVADLSIPDSPNLVAGANREGYHLRNVNYGRDWEAEIVADIALAEAGFVCPNDDGQLEIHRGIEIGHIFRLDYTYTEPMDVSVLNAEGEQVRPTMGCYGLGVERLLAAAVEEHHDEHGIIWPASIAPYDVYIVGIGLDRDEAVAAEAEALYDELLDAGLEVILDDRDERPGVKFNDADLIGVPLRLTVSPRNHEGGVIELKLRDAEEAESVARSEIVARVHAAHSELLEALRPAS